MIGDLNKDAVFQSYQEVVDQFLLEGGGEFWKCLQLRSSVRSTMHRASVFYKKDYGITKCEY